MRVRESGKERIRFPKEVEVINRISYEGFVRASREGSLLDLRVSPGARRSSIVGMYGEGAIRLKISAPPVDGKANSETERFLAELLCIPRSRVSVIRGASSRDKTVLVRGAEPEEIRKNLTELLR